MKSVRLPFWLLLLAVCGRAQAGIIDFRSGIGDGLTTFQDSVDGIIVTFSNPTNPSGPTTFSNGGDGVVLGSGDATRWDVVFDSDVSFLSFTVDFVNNAANATFNITGPGVSVTDRQPQVGLNTFASPPVFLAGQSYNFAKSTPPVQIGSFRFELWNVEPYTGAAPVPPVSWLLGAGVLGLLRVCRYRGTKPVA